MSKKFLCGGGKYQLGGPNEDSIGLPVSISGLPPKIKIEGYVLTLKPAFHTTLVAVGKIVEKYSVSIPDFQGKVVADFCESVRENPIDLLRYRDEFRFVTESEKRSVVVMCDISNLDRFFELINQKYELKIEYPPNSRNALYFTARRRYFSN